MADQPPWPPPALRPDTLGQLYNEAYEHSACNEGSSPDEAHQAACAQIYRHGFDQGRNTQLPAIGPHDKALCSCTDLRCSSVQTKASGSLPNPTPDREEP